MIAAAHKYLPMNEWYDMKVLNQKPANAVVKWILSTVSSKRYTQYLNKLNFKKTEARKWRVHGNNHWHLHVLENFPYSLMSRHGPISQIRKLRLGEVKSFA